MFKRNETEKGVELIYEVLDNEKIDNVSIGMMKNNDIKALFPIDIITNDTRVEFKYRLGAVKTLNEYISDELTKENLLEIFENICNGIRCVEEYMLFEEQVILDNDYIFFDGNNIRLILLPVINGKSNITLKVFLKNLLLDMMVKNDKAAYFASDITKQLSKEENLSYDKFLNLLDLLKNKRYTEKPGTRTEEVREERREKKGLSERKVFNIEENISKPVQARQYQGHINFEKNDNSYKSISIPNIGVPDTSFDKQSQKTEKKKGLFGFGKVKSADSLNETGSDRSNNNNLLIPGREEPINVGNQNINEGNQNINVGNQNKKEKKKFSLFGKKKEKENKVTESVMQVPKAVYGETTVLQSPANMGETTLLGFAPNIIKSFLIWRRTGEKIVIDKSDFRIGREKNYVDFCIDDNSSVGRNHAEIIQKDGAYFIRDLRSLNFTRVNGEKVSPSIEVELWDNDIISLANEEFEFHIG